jgi:hypothetical protein
MANRLKAFGVGVISLFRPVEIKKKRGRAWIKGTSHKGFLFWFLSLFYDMRQRRSGRIWIQLRQRK